MTHRLHALLSLLLMVAVLMGCAGVDEAGNNDRPPPRDLNAARQEGRLGLIAPTREVRTIQLYRTGDERRLPILPLGSGATLTLAFDVMDIRGRPLSVYFYHANRSWRRDLTPAEYLTSFQRDDLIDYQPSRATTVDYTHYTYQFPNNSIDFRISGNYILRVTEQGMEDDVLFERAFFVSEQATSVELGLDNVLTGVSSYPSIQPLAQFTPPPSIQANVFDYNVCFMRNGQIAEARCADRPMLAQQPALQFFLQPEASFAPEVADYVVDIGSVRVGGRIENTDLTQSPYLVVLEPDYARFAGTGLEPLLNGQAVVNAAVRDFPDPEVSGEYVNVRFAYVPPEERPLAGDIIVTGGFNGWRVEPANRLEWVPGAGRYEGTVLMKQGQYEYRYLVSDQRVQRALTGASPRLDNLYTVFVYYNDIRLQTDRLIAVNGIFSQ